MDDTTYIPFIFRIPKPVLVILFVVDCISYTILAFLYHVGLNPSFQAFPSPRDVLNPSTCISNNAVNSVSSSYVKSRLPTIEFSKVKSKFEEEEEEEETCGVCLFELKEKEEVRVLGNCCHVFHRDCIDVWVDRGKLTCPMCRSQLIPALRAI